MVVLWHKVDISETIRLPHWNGLMVRVSASHAVSRGFLPEMGHTKHYHNKSNTEFGIIRPTNAIYKESNSLLGSKALSKCEVNPTSRFQDIAFTSNKLLWRPSWFS